MRPSEVVRRSADYLSRHAVDSPRETAETLLMHFLATDRAGLYSSAEGLDARTARLYGRALCLRCSGMPLQYLTGRQQFMDLLLRVTPGVFVPRPETETLVEATLEAMDGVREPLVADAGTGTGAVALAVKRSRPDARVFATDISEDAVSLARANAAALDLEVRVLGGDLLSPLPNGLQGKLDIVVSNPPYISREEYESLPREVRTEPYEALVGGTDVHRRLVEEAASWLRPEGWLLTEMGEGQGPKLRDMFQGAFGGVEVLADLAGRARVVKGQKRGS